MDACTVMKREKRHNASGISNEGMQFLAMGKEAQILLPLERQKAYMVTYSPCGGCFFPFISFPVDQAQFN